VLSTLVFVVETIPNEEGKVYYEIMEFVRWLF